MADVPRPFGLWRCALAQVVAQAGKAHFNRSLQLRRHVQHHHEVHAGVYLGVVLGALRHAPESGDFGQQFVQCTALAQHLEHARRLLRHQAAREFLPDALGHQCINLAVRHHALHQRHGVGGDAEVGKSRRKTRHAKNAHRVFGKGFGDMAQHAGGDVALAAIGVGQHAVIALRDGIDGQVAPGQVFFERDIGSGMHGKAAVALGRLALGAGQRIFLTAGRMQKHRKVFAYRHIALGCQGFGRGADHDPVAVLHRQAQQGIANRTADHVNLHAPSVGSAAAGTAGPGQLSAGA